MSVDIKLVLKFESGGSRVEVDFCGTGDPNGKYPSNNHDGWKYRVTRGTYHQDGLAEQ